MDDIDGGVIRPMSDADLADVLQWRNHPDVRQYMYTRHEITLEEHRRWYERCSVDPQRHLLIFEQAGRPAGFVQFSQAGEGGVADWGFYVAPDSARGSGRRLGFAALSHAFGPLGLHKICGQALRANERSVRMHLALGFVQEGVLRDQHYDGAAYQDVIHFGLLHSEWQPAFPIQE